MFIRLPAPPCNSSKKRKSATRTLLPPPVSPFLVQAHHQGPFDRILVAQAVTGPLRLLTADKLLAQYSDVVLAV
ncbi:MAG: hypothetical protein ACYCSH_04885 [Acidithiobacillus sp.]